MNSSKHPFLLLVGIVCSAMFIASLINIAFYWQSTGYDWLFVGKHTLYAAAAGYWAWRLLFKPSKAQEA